MNNDGRTSDGRFAPGHPFGHRPKQRLAQKVFGDVLRVWNEPSIDGGDVAITKGLAALRMLYAEQPANFVKVVTSILPKDFVIEGGAFPEMDDAKLEQISALAQRLLEERIDDEADEGGISRAN
jgi:hypothetical protein